MIDTNRILHLLEQAPRPPEETLSKGVSVSECNAFEERTGICLPNDVQQWLKLANGPCVGPGGMYGIRPRHPHLDMEVCLDLYPSWRTYKWIPVAGDGCGNYYVIPTQQEYGTGFPVLFVDTSSNPDMPLFIVSSDIGHFVVALLEKEGGVEGWPFNEVYVVNMDPNITHFNSVAMPWTVE